MFLYKIYGIIFKLCKYTKQSSGKEKNAKARKEKKMSPMPSVDHISEKIMKKYHQWH